ncbi:MAG: glutamine-hydrolyzing carbamoyl-phosphate synthase small subunit [Clostridiales bacterium]|uniref:glutamine-hydrolyzing carbamoyl-phosphate synthase small subunit n=1 Tax=Clostridium sp. N3C TaxID=1776758 RepID=UPI00092E1138|nr:glutamine-hydrolyzing carbamoyl-phosphate synthase small subunit [Clostridium sp. N3C]NLZ49723.1 glutamine-hydrolyzing carbamoyl-phosphate synthase small subunit [Clostridiales bacterium]SCN25238.1 Carbamoyl-phosphate synthase small chain [Clostridium sp. N3C]
MKARLILENGIVFQGEAFGYLEETVGLVVFNTAMAGYQEVLTDPSYYGQIVVMTYPLIGNYGLNLEDVESNSPKVKGLIVQEACDYPNNFRCEIKLEDYLKNNKIIGLQKIDTRALTKVLRDKGTMKGIITLEQVSEDYIKNKLESFSNSDAVKKVTTDKVYTIDGKGKHIAVLDYGVKASVLKAFMDRDCKLTVFPYHASCEEILSVNPDLIFLSDGPGDPRDVKVSIETIRDLIGRKPIAGICLGHQLLALALGGSTDKLKYGHRGSNHPVRDLESNRVYITAQNHGYYVDKLPDKVTATHINVNDGTIEGMKHDSLPIYSVQFHPDTSSKDENNIFDKFLSL